MIRTLLAAVAPVIALAQEALPQTVVTRDSSGVAIVTSRSPTWGDKPQWTISANPQLVIGSAFGGPDELDAVTDALRLPQGDVVVANDGTRELRAFDFRGKHLWTAGGEGKGPREFGRILGLALRRDTIYAWDNRNGRMGRVTFNGTALEPVRFDPPPAAAISAQRMEGLLADTAVLLYRGSFSVPEPGPERPTWMSAPNFLYHVDGRFLGVVGSTGVEQYRTPTRELVLYLWGRRTVRAIHEGSLYTADGSEWELEVHGADGSLRKIIRLDRQRERLRDAERKAWIRQQVESLSEQLPTSGRQQAVAMFEAARLPDRKPAFGAAIVDELGYIWLGEFRHLREYALRGPRSWTILAPDGQWLGDMVLPDMEVFRIGRDWILGWRRDDLGIEQVVLYRLQRGALQTVGACAVPDGAAPEKPGAIVLSS